MEDRPPQAVVDVTERLRGEVPLPCGDDPDQLALGLKRQDVVDIQQEALLAGPANPLARSPHAGRVGGYAAQAQGLGHIPRLAAKLPRPVESLLQPLLADGLQQVVQGARFESAYSVLVIDRKS